MGILLFVTDDKDAECCVLPLFLPNDFSVVGYLIDQGLRYPISAAGEPDVDPPQSQVFSSATHAQPAECVKSVQNVGTMLGRFAKATPAGLLDLASVEKKVEGGAVVRVVEGAEQAERCADPKRVTTVRLLIGTAIVAPFVVHTAVAPTN
jgi:hypothetical protein